MTRAHVGKLGILEMVSDLWIGHDLIKFGVYDIAHLPVATGDFFQLPAAPARHDHAHSGIPPSGRHPDPGRDGLVTPPAPPAQRRLSVPAVPARPDTARPPQRIRVVRCQVILLRVSDVPRRAGAAAPPGAPHRDGYTAEGGVLDLGRFTSILRPLLAGAPYGGPRRPDAGAPYGGPRRPDAGAGVLPESCQAAVWDAFEYIWKYCFLYNTYMRLY